MASVTIPDPFPKLNDAAVPWAKDVNKALSELRDRAGITDENTRAALVQAEIAASTATSVAEEVTEVIVPQVQQPLSVPAPPTGLGVVSTTSGWTPTGLPMGEAVINWSPVTTDTNGKPLPIAGYEILTGTAGAVQVGINQYMNPSFENTTLNVIGVNSAVASSPIWGEPGAGTRSLSVTPNGASNNSYALLNTAALGLQGGKTYTFIATAHLTAPQTGTLHANARKMVFQFDLSSVVASATMDNVAGSQEFRITATMPATLTNNEQLWLYNGASTGGGSIFWDKVAVIEVASESTPYPFPWFDGNTPSTGGWVYTWAAEANNSASVAYTSSPGSVIGTVTNNLASGQKYTLTGLTPGETYSVQVRALSVYGVPGLLSEILQVTMPDAPIAATTPSDPVTDTRLGVVIAAWDGTLMGAEPPNGFMYVYAEFSRDGTEDYVQFGPQLREAGSVTLTSEPVGTTVRIRFRAVDNLGRVSAPSGEVEVLVVGVTGPDIEANSVTANHIVAGSIEATHLSPSVGGNIDISANDSITLIAGDVDALNTNVENMQTVYKFTPTEAIISAKDSPYELAIDNDSIEIRVNGVPVSWWDATQMHVTSFVGDTVVLANHQLEKYGTGTVMKAI